ncbi:MAG: metalloprotease family protein [Candidatus Moraniibacteriota bacterium]
MWIFSLLNFPGIVAHEASHKFFCDWAGVRVWEVCYFRFGNPAGFVVHEAPRKFSQSFFISVGPLILGSLLAFLLFLLFKQHPQEPLGWVFAWLGLSIASQCFPSTGDAKVLLGETWRHLFRSPLALLGLPAALLIWLAGKLNFFYFNYLFALAFFWWVLVRF